jgi:ferredoxin
LDQRPDLTVRTVSALLQSSPGACAGRRRWRHPAGDADVDRVLQLTVPVVVAEQDAADSHGRAAPAHLPHQVPPGGTRGGPHHPGLPRRCLGCRACETACPSGVEYARLLDIGRTHIERLGPRPLGERLKRFLLCRVLPYPRRLRPLLRAAQLMRPLMPHALRRHIPEQCPPAVWPVPRHARRTLLFEGCVQPLFAPGINAAAARLLDRLGIGVLPAQGCCGALSHHLAAEAQTHEHMRRNTPVQTTAR